MNDLQSAVFYVAEISANHLGSIDRAFSLIENAALSGASAVKFQTYTPETMTLDLPNFAVSAGHPLWGGKNLFSLYQEAMTPWEWHEELFKKARSEGLIPFSTPFDTTAVDFLETLDCPIYKIASLEIVDHKLIRAVGATGKPVILSTGASTLDEIREAVEVIEKTGNKNLTLLVCTSSYPSDPKDSNIRRIQTLKNEFNCKVGLSDHTLGVGASIAAIALGAEVIEKHFTLKRSDGGADGAFSMEPSEFAELVLQGRIAELSLGNEKWLTLSAESESRMLRRSLRVICDVEKDEIVSELNVKSLRPSGGAAPKFLESVIGKRFKSAHTKGTDFKLDMVN